VCVSDSQGRMTGTVLVRLLHHGTVDIVSYSAVSLASGTDITGRARCTG
jgi:hypothetical protein